MNPIEIYAREAGKIFLQISDMIKAAETDKMLQEHEQYDIKFSLQSARSILAESVFSLLKLAIQHEEECDTQQL